MPHGRTYHSMHFESMNKHHKTVSLSAGQRLALEAICRRRKVEALVWKRARAFLLLDAEPGLFMTALIWALMRWLFGVFHGLGMGHRLRGLWRLRLICRVMVSGFIGRSSRGLRRLRVAGLSSRQSVQDGDEQGFVWTG